MENLQNMYDKEKIEQALSVLVQLEMPEEQQNTRTAMCLLALLDLTEGKEWREAGNPTIGIRYILDFIRDQIGIPYAENTRETVRDESVKPMVAAGFLLRNPDKPDRATNSPLTVYQITSEALKLFRKFDTAQWEKALAGYLSERPTLASLYAREREEQRTVIKLNNNDEIRISAGEHSSMIKKVLEEFKTRFAPDAVILYVGDTGEKWGRFDKEAMAKLGIRVEMHGQMPDIILFSPSKNWLYIIESATSNGPIDGRRYEELLKLLAGCKAGLIFITAFPDRKTMRKFLSVLAWETEVWVADAPGHLIHFDGDKFLGPHKNT
jgi:hypothetical protein